MGETSPNKPPYLFWSGIGAVLRWGAAFTVLHFYLEWWHKKHK